MVEETSFTPYQKIRYEELKAKAKEQVYRETSMDKYNEMYDKMSKSIAIGVKKGKFTKDFVSNYKAWSNFFLELLDIFIASDKERLEKKENGIEHYVVYSIRPLDRDKIDYDFIKDSLTKKTYKVFKEQEKLIPKDSNAPYAYDLLDVFCKVVSE